MPELIPDFDLYAELEIGEAATTATIEAAWRALMKRNHPDVGPAGSIHRSVRLNVAHDWLTDPARRARYDTERAEIRRRRDAARRQAAAARHEAGARQRPGGATPAQRASAASRGWDRRSRPGQAGQPRQPPAAAGRAGRHTIRMAHPTRPRRDWLGIGRTALTIAVFVAVLVIVGVVRMLVGGPAGLVTAIPARATATAALALGAPSATPAASAAAFPAPSPSPTAASSPPPSPFSSPTFAPSPGTASSPTTPAASALPAITGSGNRDGIAVRLDAGTYAIGYVVSAAPAAECGWVLFLTDSFGFETLVASAYPLPGETVRDTETAASVAAGAATARVESDCPGWLFTMTHTGP